MNDAGKLMMYSFVLLALLIFAAYYAGLSTDARAFGASATSVMYALTGRNSSGQFQSYPSGAPSVP